MTTKVIKGSMWTLGGSVIPLAVSFISTPFIIRFLGTESYGVLLLVGLIPTYFSFADFGMGVASTKFAAEAYGQGDEKKEVEFVWTATAIATASALVVALPLFLFSFQIVRLLNVPEHLLAEANIALKIASVSFFIGILSSVLNSPMLARLRMDLNTVTQAVPRILLAVVTPFVLYFGGGIIGAVGWSFLITVGMLGAVTYFSGRLLPRLVRPTINRDFVRPLLKFGGAWFVAMVAAILLVNLEKLFLTKLVSVKALAYYSVAFTFANMATMFSMAMTQSLVPAFSQLQMPEKKAEFDSLFSRSIRLNIIWLLPVLLLMFVVAKPFFTVWAGEDFGRESTFPFYLLLIGLFFNILAYVPHASITAAGRTDIFAKLYWIELVVYVAVAFFMIGRFGIIGAAAAWSIRITLDAILVILLSKKITRTAFLPFAQGSAPLAAAVASLILPLLAAMAFNVNSTNLILVACFSTTVYSFIVWNRLMQNDERDWMRTRLSFLIK